MQIRGYTIVRLVTRVSSRDGGTGNFPGNSGFWDFPFPGKFVSGSREIFIYCTRLVAYIVCDD